MTALDPQSWIGRTDTIVDYVSLRLVQEFHATLNPHLVAAGAQIAPLLIHWCLGPTTLDLDELGPDGHPRLGGFLPPISLPRRMWASGKVEFFDDLMVGDCVTRRSTISRIEQKSGKTGELWFVDIQHELKTNRGLAIKELQTLVYRDIIAPAASSPEALIDSRSADSTVFVDTSTVRLFRYSAITFNSHRIHYDEPYATSVENYPGVVVHGPLQATLMINQIARAKEVRPDVFQYRGTSALIAGQPMEIRVRQASQRVDCCVCNSAGHMTMEGSAAWRA